MKYLVVVRAEEEGGFGVSCPGLPGCYSQGETREEALENIAIAIREYLEAVAEEYRGAEVHKVEAPEVEIAA